MIFYVPTCITNYTKSVIKLDQHIIKLQYYNEQYNVSLTPYRVLFNLIVKIY